MPKNLRHLFRSELIKQRKSGLRTSRNAIKNSKGGKMADYRHIYSDNSYKKHWSRAKRFANYCKQKGVKKMDEITPQFAKTYLIYERDKSVNGYSGYSASTIASDALMLNHVFIGSGHWKESEKLQKSKIANMPKRSQKIFTQRQKPLTSKEWISTHPHTYSTYKPQIDTLRAFGLRRRELVGGTSKSGSDGLGDRSLYLKSGRIWAVVQGKGGKIRWTPCRKDMQTEMEQLYAGKIRAWSERPKNTNDFKHNLKINRVFYRSFDHNVPSHIHRAEYAQKMIAELNQYHYEGQKQITIYRKDGYKPSGKAKYSKGYKYLNLAKSHKIGSYTASYGAFYKLSQFMGHNRLDILQSYLGEGR